VILALAAVASLLSLAAALAAVLGRRDSVQEAEALRREVAALAQRLQEAERAAERAAGRAEAAGQLLLDKGIVSEGELEAFREPLEGGERQAPRSPRTVH